MTERMFSAREIARLKGITPSAVYVASARGLLSKIHVDGRTVFAEEEVQHYLRRKPGRRPKSGTAKAATLAQGRGVEGTLCIKSS